jgi:hypothetical protein
MRFLIFYINTKASMYPYQIACTDIERIPIPTDLDYGRYKERYRTNYNCSLMFLKAPYSKKILLRSGNIEIAAYNSNGEEEHCYDSLIHS